MVQSIDRVVSTLALFVSSSIPDTISDLDSIKTHLNSVDLIEISRARLNSPSYRKKSFFSLQITSKSTTKQDPNLKNLWKIKDFLQKEWLSKNQNPWPMMKRKKDYSWLNLEVYKKRRLRDIIWISSIDDPCLWSLVSLFWVFGVMGVGIQANTTALISFFALVNPFLSSHRCALWWIGDLKKIVMLTLYFIILYINVVWINMNCINPR